MGCCSFLATKFNGGISIPEQEEVIAMLESRHVFAEMDTRVLLEAMKKEQSCLLQSQFLEMVHKWGIPTETFKRPEMSIYLSKLMKQPGFVDLKQLRISAILLGKHHWQAKLSQLFDLYKENEYLSEKQLHAMLFDMIYISTVVHSSMAIVRISKISMDHYISKIRTAQSFLISAVAQINSKQITKGDLLDYFKGRPELQKIFYSNGIRIVLLEGDINSYYKSIQKNKLLEDHLDTDHCSPRQTLTEESK